MTHLGTPIYIFVPMFSPFLQLEKTENNDKSFECCAMSNPAATATTTSLPTTNNVINPNTFLDMAPRNASTASATSAAAGGGEVTVELLSGRVYCRREAPRRLRCGAHVAHAELV